MFPDIQKKYIRRPRLEDGGDVPQLRMVAANIPNKQSRTVNDEDLSLGGWEKWYGLFTVQLQRVTNVTRGRGLSTLRIKLLLGQLTWSFEKGNRVYKLGRIWPSMWILTWGFRSSAVTLNSMELIPHVSKERTAFIFSSSGRSLRQYVPSKRGESITC